MRMKSDIDLKIFLEPWKNEKAAKYIVLLKKYYGYPDYVVKSYKEKPAYACWINIAGVDSVDVYDESIPHAFPMTHTDYCYSTLRIPEWQQKEGKHMVPPTLMAAFAKVTGSIIIDPLKGEATARCATLVKNAVTLKFVQDGIKNPSIVSSNVYSKRIKSNSPTIGYNDVLKEKEGKKENLDVSSLKGFDISIMTGAIGPMEI